MSALTAIDELIESVGLDPKSAKVTDLTFKLSAERDGIQIDVTQLATPLTVNHETDEIVRESFRYMLDRSSEKVKRIQ